MNPKTKYFLLIFLIAYPLDQLSKQWIIANVYYGEVLPMIPGFFEITQVRNPGGAFSLFAGGSPAYRMYFFLGTGVVAVTLLLVFFWKLEPHAKLAAAALGAILGGALGNLTDRVVHSEVIDFLNVHLSSTYTWPTFNFADSFIVVGVGVLLAEVFFADGSGAETQPAVEDASRESRALSQ